MQRSAIVLALALGATAPAFADVNVGFDLPGQPDLVQIPGYPVDYAPQVDANYFFYDGLYWVLDGSQWYSSSGYNGPWQMVAPYDVPALFLQVPVSYFRYAPTYYGGWYSGGASRWGDRRQGGWDGRTSFDGGGQHGDPQRGGQHFGGGAEHGGGGGQHFGGSGAEHGGGGSAHGGGGEEHGGGGR